MMTDSLNDPLKSAELPKESTLENEESDIQRWSFQKDRLISATPIDEKTQRSEREALSQYIQDLRSRHFDGLPLIEFPEDYGVWIDKLLLENRFEKSSLRFEDYFKKFCDLPIQDDSEKEKIEQELQSIDKLDEILRQKTNEAHQIQNETLSSIIQNNPFHYDEQNTIHTDLTNELRDFKRKERLRRAMKIQNEETTSSLDSQNLPSNRHQWTPEDTSRIKALMENDDWMENPFDCDVCLEFLLPNSRSITCSGHEERTANTSSSQDSSYRRSCLSVSLKPDYLRQMREDKERHQRLLEIDSLLHDIRTGDVYQTSIPSSLKDLIEETRMELENNGIAVLDIEQIRSFLDPNTEFV